MWWSTKQDLNRLPSNTGRTGGTQTMQAAQVVIRDKETGKEIRTFRGGSLEGADLSKTRFRYADLRGQNMHFANLNASNFWGADMRGADLRGADLRGANLRRANLEDAKLAGANLTDAIYDQQTVWPADFDLSWERVRLVED